MKKIILSFLIFSLIPFYIFLTKIKNNTNDCNKKEATKPITKKSSAIFPSDLLENEQLFDITLHILSYNLENTKDFETILLITKKLFQFINVRATKNRTQFNKKIFDDIKKIDKTIERLKVILDYCNMSKEKTNYANVLIWASKQFLEKKCIKILERLKENYYISFGNIKNTKIKDLFFRIYDINLKTPKAHISSTIINHIDAANFNNKRSKELEKYDEILNKLIDPNEGEKSYSPLYPFYEAMKDKNDDLVKNLLKENANPNGTYFLKKNKNNKKKWHCNLHLYLKIIKAIFKEYFKDTQTFENNNHINAIIRELILFIKGSVKIYEQNSLLSPEPLLYLPPLHAAIYQLMIKSVKTLIEYGADVNLQSNLCPSPLIVALLKLNHNNINADETKKMIHIIKTLLMAEADVNQKCSMLENKTPLEIAQKKVEKGLIPKEMLKLLEKRLKK